MVREIQSWSAGGVLFENCNCQLLCPGHLSFKQLCNHERCVGAWAMHFEQGRYGDHSLGGLNVLIPWDSPRHMIAGGWTTQLFLDERADPGQRDALEAILSGAAGGPWSVLAQFVARRLASRIAPIQFEDAGRTKRMWIEGELDTAIEAIRGKDKAQEAVLANVFNQIHTPVQVLALGQTRSSVPEFGFEMRDTHAIHSRFSWQVA